MRYLFIVLSLFAYTLSQAQACSPADKEAYRKVAVSFCDFVAKNAKPTTDLFTPSLIAAIAKAEKQNLQIAKAHPDEKPPLGDGVPYQSYPDHAPDCAPGTNVHVDHQLYMEVKHTFPDQPKADWTDRLHLVKMDAGWKIDDIRYAPDYTDGLREALTELFKE